MIKVPDRFTYAEFYLTFRCTFSCSYCINAHSGISRHRNELSAREWALALNNIDTQHIPLTFGGGEPTVHKEFYDIVDSLSDDKRIDLLTNGTFDVNEFMRRIPASRFTAKAGTEYKSIRMSYHPGHTDENVLLNTANALQENGYGVGIFSINHPGSLIHNVSMTQKCSERKLYFFIRDFLGFYDDKLYGHYKYPGALIGQRAKCLCRTEELLVGPDGSAYRCHADLYAGENPVGNILNMAFEIEDTFRPCAKYGMCNPCDIKKKLAPDLSTSKCAVEIKEIQS